MIVFCDLETTGLDPNNEDILEVAMIVTDDSLNEVARKELVVRPTPRAVSRLDTMVPFVRDMHTKSGLLAEIEARGGFRAAVEREMVEWLKPLLPSGLEKANIAGNSVHFDLNFLRANMPKISDLLHYRIIDVSTLNELARRWTPTSFALRPNANGEPVHRAMPDAEQSLATLRHYAQELFNASVDWPTPYVKETHLDEIRSQEVVE